MAYFFAIQPYLNSYLQVVQDFEVSTAGRVTQTFAFMSTISAFAVSLLIKYTRRYRIYATVGSAVYMLGFLLMYLFRQEGSSYAQILVPQILVGLLSLIHI